jgi:hypothetical protein
MFLVPILLSGELHFLLGTVITVSSWRKNSKELNQRYFFTQHHQLGSGTMCCLSLALNLNVNVCKLTNFRLRLPTENESVCSQSQLLINHTCQAVLKVIN